MKLIHARDNRQKRRKRGAMQQNGFSTGVVIALGVAFGTAIGVALHNYGAGIGIGLGIGGVFAGTRALIQARRNAE